MKGYIINKKCYIFPQTAAEIPAVEADVFYVQEENFAAWLAANESLADKLKKYNYNVMTVNQKEWAGHTNDDLEPPVVLYDITYSGDTTHVTGPATSEAGATITITPTTQDEFSDITLTSSDASITKNAENWTFTMPEADVAIAVAYAPTYTITYFGAEYVDHDAVTSAAEGDTVTVYLKDTSTLDPAGGSYTPNGGAYVDGNWQTFTISHPDTFTYQFTMLGGDAEFAVNYEPPHYNITKTGAEAAYADVESDAGAGTTVYVSPIDENYTFDKACTEPGVTILDVTSTDVSLVYPADGHYQWNDHYSFTMPASDVTITVTEYTPQPHDYSQDYFTIRSLDDNNDVSFTQDQTTTGDLYYSLDNGSTWNTYTNAITLDNDETALFKGNLDPEGDGIGTFTALTPHVVEGNIMSLLKGDNFVGETDLTGKDSAFKSLFDSNTTLTSAENLVLPATTLADECYQKMFKDCSLLTTAPELPATTLTTGCYEMMFIDCTSLNYIKCLATDISATDCTSSWVDDVAASGTFVKDASMTNWRTGGDGIPSGWTVEDEQVTPQ